MSKPPRAIKRPKKTTICIISFFLVENFKANIENIKIGIPIIEGMNDVNEELEVTKFTNRPHNISKIPYRIEIDSILSPKNLYSF
tara:strand:- start:1695 stop:1949 length:255 start_codon:yes stop_codon:yes gene_type:complete